MTLPPKVWDGARRRLRDELAPVSYEMWIAKIVARAAEPDREGGRADGGVESGADAIELLCPNHFHAVRVRDFFSKPIHDALQAELGRRVAVRIGVATDRPAEADQADCAAAVPQVKSPEAKAAKAKAEPAMTLGKSSVDSGSCDAVRMVVPRPKRRTETTPIGDALGSLLGGTPAVSKATASARGDEAKPTPGASEPCRERRPERPRRAVATRPVAHAHAHAHAHAAAAGGARVGPSTASMRQPTFPLTFDAFTVGPANALAREAAMALATPASNGGQLGLNQVFIVSGSGLGKTHLARAAAAEGARTIGPRARYTTAETFTSEFTSAIRGDKMHSFKKRYRGECDLLVVDDVQFLEGKAATQLEFFHTVQHVLDAGGRVLLTGDRFPQELTHLDPRVRARIASSVVAEVQDPDAGLRGEILRAKAAHGGVRLPDDCVELLVERVEGSVRELEGALIQLVTVASLFKRPIDLDLTRESLDGRARSLRLVDTPATTQVVIETVAGFFKTTPDALASRSRRRDVLVPRQIAMYLCRRFTDASLADVGRELNRDHPSVANAIRKIERNLLENVRLRYQVEALIGRLRELGHRPIHSAD